jgi:hypothetical protein
VAVVAVRLSPSKVVASSVDALGLDREIADFETPEVLAAAIRRAAAFMCPTSPRHLVRAVEGVRRGLVPSSQSDESDGSVRALVENLVAYGDLVEVPLETESGMSRRMLFLGPPSYVTVSRRTVLLFGVRGEGLSLVDDALSDRIEYQVHVRLIHLEQGEDAQTLFENSGLSEVSLDQWLEAPSVCAAVDLYKRYSERLEAAGPSGTIDGCRILDPGRPPEYYRGRWRSPRLRDEGLFVARRPVAFGADLWCFVELVRGNVQRLIDLPALHILNRGCDEAWRLQAAVDYLSGNPQTVRVGPAYRPTDVVLHVQSPIPSWAQRYLEVLGRPLPRHRGSLISYNLAKSVVQDALRFLRDSMWIGNEYRGV